MLVSSIPCCILNLYFAEALFKNYSIPKKYSIYWRVIWCEQGSNGHCQVHTCSEVKVRTEQRVSSGPNTFPKAKSMLLLSSRTCEPHLWELSALLRVLPALRVLLVWADLRDNPMEEAGHFQRSVQGEADISQVTWHQACPFHWEAQTFSCWCLYKDVYCVCQVTLSKVHSNLNNSRQ